ncbi:MAG: hypothetical protein FWG87_13540 [Defluviitaleaceae bacterium]|nr:hypothetical protein [Defluviitaleaceae bacterium]
MNPNKKQSITIISLLTLTLALFLCVFPLVRTFSEEASGGELSDQIVVAYTYDEIAQAIDTLQGRIDYARQVLDETMEADSGVSIPTSKFWATRQALDNINAAIELAEALIAAYESNHLTIIVDNICTREPVAEAELEIFVNDVGAEFQIHDGVITIPYVKAGSHVRLTVNVQDESIYNVPTWKSAVGDVQIPPLEGNPDLDGNPELEFIMPFGQTVLLAEFETYEIYTFPWNIELEWDEELANEPIEYIFEQPLGATSEHGTAGQITTEEITVWGMSDSEIYTDFADVQEPDFLTNDIEEFTVFGQNENTWQPSALADSMSVSVPFGIFWSVTSTAPSWLSISNEVRNPPHTNDSFRINVTENTGNSARTGTVRLSLAGYEPIEIVVTQGYGAVLELSGNAWTSHAEGQAVYVEVFTNQSRQWTVSSNRAWLAVGEFVPTNRTGSGRFTIATEPHLESGARTGTITVTAAGVPSRTITVTQNAGAVLLTPEGTISIPNGAIVGLKLDITSNRAWTIASSQPSWLTASPTLGTGNGSYVISTAAHVGASSRTGRITVSATGATSRSIDVTQEAGNGLVLSASEEAVPAMPNIGTVNVFSDRTWNVPTSNVAWLTISNITPSSRIGNGSFYVNVAPNLANSQRTGTITVRTQDGTTTRTIIVTQRSGDVLVLSGNLAEATADGGIGRIDVTSNRLWNASVASNATSWLSVFPSTWQNSGTFYIDASENLAPTAREGVITVSVPGVPSLTQTIRTRQARSWVTPLDVSANIGTVRSAGGTEYVWVRTSAVWQVSSDSSWLSADGFIPQNRSGNGSFRLTADPNPNSTPRTGRITVSAPNAVGAPVRYIEVTQNGRGGIQLSLDEWSPTSAASHADVMVTATGAWSASSSDTSWLTVSSASGNGDGSFRISVTANYTLALRVGFILVTHDGVTTWHAVVQSAEERYLTSFSWNEDNDSWFKLVDSVINSGGQILSNTTSSITATVYGVTHTFTDGDNGVVLIPGIGLAVRAGAFYNIIIAQAKEIIFLGAHRAFDEYNPFETNPPLHTMAIMFLTEHTDTYINNRTAFDMNFPRWGNIRYATIGGTSDGNVPFLWGTYKSDTDHNLSTKRFMRHIHTGVGKISELFAAFHYFDEHNTKKIVYLVAIDNSNSYARGILEAVGLSPTLPSGVIVPGWEKPVAPSYFGK